MPGVFVCSLAAASAGYATRPRPSAKVLPANPDAAVRGPKHVVTKGSTPVPSPAEARKLLDRIDTGSLAGSGTGRSSGVMLYSFARVKRGPGDAEAGLLPAGEPAQATREGREAARCPGPPPCGGGPRRLPRGGRARGGWGRRWERLTGRTLTRRVRAGHDQAAGGGRRAAARDVPPHVPGDGYRGVSVERGDSRARAAGRSRGTRLRR